MNRIEFCTLLLKAKENSGKSTNTISFDLRMQWTTLRRLEKGEHNFNLKKVMEYLNVINSKLVLVLNTKNDSCLNYNDIVAWIKNARQDVFTQRQLANEIGSAHPTIANIERGTTVVSIDTFLKIVEVLGYELKIEKI